MTPARPDTGYCTTPSAAATFDRITTSPHVYQHESICLSAVWRLALKRAHRPSIQTSASQRQDWQRLGWLPIPSRADTRGAETTCYTGSSGRDATGRDGMRKAGSTGDDGPTHLGRSLPGPPQHDRRRFAALARRWQQVRAL